MPCLQIASHIAYYYSIRRTIRNKNGTLTNIISFPTQQLPVFTGVAQSYVLKAFSKHAVKHFVDPSLNPYSKHGVATAYKAILCQHSKSSHLELSERCGAQGLFGYNQIVSQNVYLNCLYFTKSFITAFSLERNTGNLDS